MDGSRFASVRQTQNYIWSVTDRIGTGATGSVYKCRQQATGEIYAAKEVNKNIPRKTMNPAIKKEVHILTKLEHENIVKFINLEFSTEGYCVIIMEFCIQSLHDVIQLPENEYGLCEQDYKDVVSDVTAGMEYLRNNNIVHRDVKPGNILQVQNIDTGRYRYKISDFGAARDLRDSEQFESIYGTEEYLHPDIYEKAIMKYSKGPFNNTVDLWSLGVTFYHLATGILPFKPHHGRSDKTTMHKMLTQKAAGVISCHQNRENGELEYSKDLPRQTRISKGLKALVMPILRGLLETHPERKISYDDFFKKIEDLKAMKEIHVYCNKNSVIHSIYINQQQNFHHLQDVLASFTSINATDQRLFYNYDEFKPHTDKKICDYPDTTQENPLILLSTSFVESEHLKPTTIPQLEYQGGTRKSREEDVPYSKLFVNNACHLRLETEKLEHECASILKARHLYRSAMIRFCDLLEYTCEDLKDKTNQNYSHMCSNAQILSKLSDEVEGQDGRSETKENDLLYNEILRNLQLCLKRRKELLNESLLDQIFDDGFTGIEQLPDKSLLRSYINIINKINEQFYNDSLKLSTNLDNLVHHYERNRLVQTYRLMREKVVRFQLNRNKLHDIFNTWLLAVMRRKRELLEEQARISDLYEEFHQQYHQQTDKFAEKFDDVLKKLMVPLDEFAELPSLVENQTNDLLKMKSILQFSFESS